MVKMLLKHGIRWGGSKIKEEKHCSRVITETTESVGTMSNDPRKATGKEDFPDFLRGACDKKKNVGMIGDSPPT